MTCEDECVNPPPVHINWYAASTLGGIHNHYTAMAMRLTAYMLYVLDVASHIRAMIDKYYGIVLFRQFADIHHSI